MSESEDWHIRLDCLHQECDGTLQVRGQDFDKRLKCPKCSARYIPRYKFWLESDDPPTTIRSGTRG